MSAINSCESLFHPHLPPIHCVAVVPLPPLLPPFTASLFYLYRYSPSISLFPLFFSIPFCPFSWKTILLTPSCTYFYSLLPSFPFGVNRCLSLHTNLIPIRLPFAKSCTKRLLYSYMSCPGCVTALRMLVMAILVTRVANSLQQTE